MPTGRGPGRASPGSGVATEKMKTEWCVFRGSNHCPFINSTKTGFPSVPSVILGIREAAVHKTDEDVCPHVSSVPDGDRHYTTYRHCGEKKAEKATHEQRPEGRRVRAPWEPGDEVPGRERWGTEV